MAKKRKSNEDPNIATIEDLAEFFSIHRTSISDLMNRMGVPRRGAGFPWVRTWTALGVDLKSVSDWSELRKPLLNLQEVARRLGESPKTTRRRGDGKHRDKEIPYHIDFGEKTRLYFASEIRTWIDGDPIRFGREQCNLFFLPPKDVQKTKRCKLPPSKRAPAVPPKSATAKPVAVMFMAPPPKT